MKKTLAVAALAATALIGTATSATAATVDKYGLSEPGASVLCGSLSPLPGEPGREPIDGFAIFKADLDTDTLSVVLSVKRLAPNTDYPVRLIQGSAVGGLDDCLEFDTVLHTNGVGNGTIQWHEPIAGDRAQVIINTVDFPEGYPWYRATQAFTIPTA